MSNVKQFFAKKINAQLSPLSHNEVHTSLKRTTRITGNSSYIQPHEKPLSNNALLLLMGFNLRSTPGCPP